MPTYTSFEQLDCWRKCRLVVSAISETIKRFPDHEKYDLADNMRRAARSSTRNIAEGFGRHHHGENMQFCRISRGSLFELLDDLITARDCAYINSQEYQDHVELIGLAIKSINGFLHYLKSL